MHSIFPCAHFGFFSKVAKHLGKTALSAPLDTSTEVIVVQQLCNALFSLIKLTTKCTNTNTEKNLSRTGRRKKIYVPGKDFVPHFYPGKVGEKNTSKTEPLLSQGIWPSFFFFIPGRLWPKKTPKKTKNQKKEICPKPPFRQKNICVFAFKLLLETKECKWDFILEKPLKAHVFLWS